MSRNLRDKAGSKPSSWATASIWLRHSRLCEYYGKLSTTHPRFRGDISHRQRHPSEMVHSLTTKMEKTIRVLNESLQLIRKRLDSLEWTFVSHRSSITELEPTLAAHDSQLEWLKQECHSLKHANVYLLEKLDDLENCSRRCNLRIVGISEGLELNNPIGFTKSCFLTRAQSSPADVLHFDQSRRLYSREDSASHSCTQPDSGWWWMEQSGSSSLQRQRESFVNT